jgi:hypothetical protein
MVKFNFDYITEKILALLEKNKEFEDINGTNFKVIHVIDEVFNSSASSLKDFYALDIDIDDDDFWEEVNYAEYNFSIDLNKSFKNFVLEKEYDFGKFDIYLANDENGVYCLFLLIDRLYVYDYDKKSQHYYDIV